MAVIDNVAAGTQSSAHFVPAGTIITVTPSAGATATVMYTVQDRNAITNNVATYLNWPKGAVTSSASDLAARSMRIRVVATGGTVQLSTNTNPTNVDLAPYLADFGGSAKYATDSTGAVVGLTAPGGSIIGFGGGGYVLPTASATTLGGIKIGTGLSIDGTGTVTASGGGGSAINQDSTFTLTDWVNNNRDTYPVMTSGARPRSKALKRDPATRRLVQFDTLANTYSTQSGLSDVTTNDAMLGTSAVQLQTTSLTTHFVAPTNANVLTTPINATGAIMKFCYKPINPSPVGTISTFNFQLFSSGTPTAPGSNYHEWGGSGIVQTITANGGNEGRWQGYGVAISQFSAVGTGADLTAITWGRIVVRTTSGTWTIQLGYIDIVPNRLTKAKVILGFDDLHDAQWEYVLPLMARYGFPGVIYPGALGQTAGNSASWTPKRIQNANDFDDWQIGSQAYSTEANTLDGFTEAQRVADFQKLASLHSGLGVQGGIDGSYFSNVGFVDMQVWPTFRKFYRSMRIFKNGAPAAVQTFPPADPHLWWCMNGVTFNDSTNGDSLVAHAQLAITHKGVAEFAWHNDLGNAGTVTAGQTGFKQLLAFCDANRSLVDVVTKDDLYLSYGG
jgi:hypothetical protein